MIIGSKASLEESELKDRKDKGIKFLEIQLNLKDMQNLEETINKKYLFYKYNLTSYALQPPLLNSLNKECLLGDVNLQSRKENLNLIKKTIILADKISEVSNPMVIISVGGLVSNDEFIPDFSRRKKGMVQKDIWEIANFVTEKYPKVMIVLKNNPPCKEIEGVKYNYGYGYEDDFINWIRDIKCKNVGVALDIAHAMGVINYNKKHNEKSDFISINHFLHSYAPYLKLIQLSKGIGYASNDLEVGKPFEATAIEDAQTIKGIFEILNAIKYNAPITLSSNEDDAENAINFVSTRTCLIQAFKK